MNILQQMLGMDLDLSEEDQMMRAIAMSLGENVTMSTDKEGEKKEEEDREKKTDEDGEKDKDKQIPEDPLDKETIDHFTENVMCGMFLLCLCNQFNTLKKVVMYILNISLLNSFRVACYLLSWVFDRLYAAD